MENIFKDDILAMEIWRKKYCMNNETFDEWLNRVSGGNEHIKHLIVDKKFIFGGRTLSNRGLSGSLSNCYTSGRVQDSLDSIMSTAKNIALTFKAQGGQGISLTLLRPKGSPIAGRYESDGIVPFMKIFDNITGNISQGNSRRGALLMSLDITHKEAETFMKIKSDLHEINNANLSLEINDEFMKMVKKFYDVGVIEVMHIKKTFGPEDNPSTIEYDIIPIELFKIMCKYAHGFAEPGVLFMNRINNYNLNSLDPNYTIECSNPCGEQPLIANGCCNLSAINLGKYVKDPFTDSAEFRYYELRRDLRCIYAAMNNIVDEGISKHALPEQREAALNWRNIGIGIMGLADVFLMFKTPYGSDKSIELTRDIMGFLFRECLNLNIIFGKKYGNFPNFNTEINYNDTPIIKTVYEATDEPMPKITHLRNCSMLTIAPTGSIGTMLNVSMGIEPLFALSYKRRTVSLNGEDTVYTVYPSVVDMYLRLHPEDSIDTLPYYFVTAQDLDWKLRIDVQAEAQKFIDTGISSTVNLPKETTVEEVQQLYLYAWEKELKGVTIYRDGSRDPILFTDKTEKPIAIKENHAMKRPKELDAELTVVKASGKSYAVILGFLSDKPYEVFAFEMPDNSSIKPTKGVLVKIKKGQYMFKCPEFKLMDLQLSTDKMEERAVTILGSMLLRHNVGIAQIIKVIKKVNPVITSFTSAVCRVLAKYSTGNTTTSKVCPECGEPLVMEGGCEHCSKCTYAKCNVLIKKRKEA